MRRFLDKADLARILKTLEVDAQLVLACRWGEQLSQDETAAVMGISTHDVEALEALLKTHVLVNLTHHEEGEEHDHA